MAIPKSMKVSEVIKYLEAIKAQAGDVQVYLSKDPEGNGYATIHKDSFSIQSDLKGSPAILWPWREFYDFE